MKSPWSGVRFATLLGSADTCHAPATGRTAGNAGPFAQDISPRDLAITDDEAGKQATRSLDEEGSDGR